jgi:ABC-type nitrate/sulfonate/bicarbonate transport system substrate-binding protein
MDLRRVLPKTVLKRTSTTRLSGAAIIFLLIGLTPGARAAGPETLRLAFSSFSASGAGFFTAIEEKQFERRGIGLTHLYIASSSVVLPAILTRGSRSCDPQRRSRRPRLSSGGQEPGDHRHARGQVHLFAIHKPEIKRPQGLRGKVLGVSRFGGSLDIALRYGLQHLGLDPQARQHHARAGGRHV